MSSRLDEYDEVNPDIDQQQYLSLNDEKAAAAAAEQDDDDVTESSIFNTHALRVLAVDDSVVCLKILVALLRQCKYNVTETTNPVEALQILRTRKHEFDMVITDLRMLEMDGLVLLQKVSLEMDLPVVMLSADDKHDNIMKAIRYGARDYLIKPPRMAQIQNVWQHVVRKRLFGPNCKDVNNNNNNTSSITREEEETPCPPKFNESKRKLDETEGDDRGKACVEAESSECSKKKKRVNWTPDLHNKFTDAIERIGPKAVPMEILKLMNVPGLTRANVASHLQKFKNAIRSQAHSEPQARNVYSSNVNYAAGRNGYQSSVDSLHASYSMGMMIQDIGTNPYLPQKLSFHQNNQNSRIFPESANQHLMTYGEHYNLPVNPPASLAPTMLNNAPLPPRKVLTNQPPVPRFDGLMFSTTGNNMTNSYPSSQPFPAFPSSPALFPSHTTYPSAFAGNMPIAISSALNAYSRQNDMQGNGHNYLETENIYPQLNCAVTSGFLDTPMRNSNTTTSNFVVDPFQTTQMETWITNNNSVVNPAHISAPFETSNPSNSNNMKVEVQHFHSTTHEELHIDASFQPINTNLSDEDDNDELNSMVNSFKFEVPPSL